MGLNSNDNKAEKVEKAPEETIEEFKSSPIGSDQISLVLDELDFQDAMKRSIILGICTRLVNNRTRTKSDLALEIKHHGAIAFLAANMEPQETKPSADDALAIRGVASRRRALGRRNTSSSMGIIPPGADAIIEAQLAHETAGDADSGKPVDGETLLERIRSRMAEDLVQDPSGSNGDDRGK